MNKIILTPKQLMEWPDLEHRLSEIFWQLVNLWIVSTMKINSIHRTPQADRDAGGSGGGVHTAGPPFRAIDISIWTISLVRDEAQAEAERLAGILNSMWIYDPKRPKMVVCYVKPHGEGPHIHLQVHPNTKRRSK